MYRTRLLGEKLVRFGVISDTHFASKHFAESAFVNIAEWFHRRKIELVFHCGDIVAGYSEKWAGSLVATGLDEQLAIARKQLLRLAPMEIVSIYGNHDATFTKLCGADMAQQIEQACGIVCLGGMEADVMVNDCLHVRIKHPKGGRCKTLSLPSQNEVSLMRRDSMPHLILMGHRHVYCSCRPQGVECVECMSFEWPDSDFSKSMGHGIEVGGMIISVSIPHSGPANKRRFSIERRTFE